MEKNAPVIRLAIADDHKLVRDGIVALLSVFPEFLMQIVAADGKDLLHKIELHKENLPEICLLDINMPEMNGYETLIQLKQKWPAIKVLVISVFNEEMTVIKMVQNGADGYLTKNCSADQIHEGIMHLKQKGYYHTELVAHSLMHSLKQNKDAHKKNISDRDIQFLCLCCTDLTYQQIAQELFVSTSTAEKWRDSLFEKFDVHSRVGLAMFTIKSGLYYLKS